MDDPASEPELIEDQYHGKRSRDPATRVKQLLAHTGDQRVEWVAAHSPDLKVSLIAELKQRSDALLLSDPLAANELTCCALLVAQYLHDEPLALSLACWARGNWETYHEPHAAIRYYQQALDGYAAAGDTLSVGRLLGNLVFAYCECGSFAEAQVAYEQASAIFRPLGRDAAFYLLRLEQNYGWLLHSQGRYEAALDAYDRAITLAHELEQPIVAAEIQVNRAVTLGMIGRLSEGETMLLSERAIAGEHHQELTLARIDLNLGWLSAARGQPAQALRRFQTARDRFAALDNHMDVGTVLMLEAALFERIGAVHEARRSYASAQATFAALQTRPLLGTALLRGAAAHRLAGMYPQAIAMLAEAEALWEALNQPLWSAHVLFERVELALACQDGAEALRLLRRPLAADGVSTVKAQRDILLADALLLDWQTAHSAIDPDEASQAYRRSLDYAVQQGERWMQRRALAGLGRLALAIDPQLGQSYLEAAVVLDDLTREELSVEELKAGFQTQTSDLLPLLARLAVENGQPLRALAHAWHAKSGALLDLLYAANRDTEIALGAQTELEHIRQELASHRWLAARQAADRAPESALEIRDPTIRALEQRLRELRRARNLQRAPAAALVADPASAIEGMEADLLIEYLRCDDSLLALRVARDGSCQAIWIADFPAIEALLDAILLGFQYVLGLDVEARMQRHDMWLAECQPLLQRCHSLLIAPLGALPDGAHLLIAPCDSLYQLPFAALWDGHQYLAERYTLETIISGGLLAAPQRPTATTAPLIIAASAGGRLAAVAQEAAAIQAALPGSICLVDQPQSLNQLIALQAPPRVLHIAAHSILRQDAPIFSALQLADELLAVEQCYDLPLDGTTLVTLSGCTTAAGLNSGGALLAFQSAFFVAGAQHVLSSLWAIDDDATLTWMHSYYQYLAAGTSPVAALRQTQRALLERREFAHPAFWSTFICSRR